MRKKRMTLLVSKSMDDRLCEVASAVGCSRNRAAIAMLAKALGPNMTVESFEDEEIIVKIGSLVEEVSNGDRA